MTVQAEILDLLRLARDEFDASVLIITHNMGVIADIADQVVVMYRGHVVEQGDVEQIFYHRRTTTPSDCWVPCRASVRSWSCATARTSRSSARPIGANSRSPSRPRT